MKLRHALAGTVALPLAIAVAGSAQANVTIFDDGTTEISNYGRIQLALENSDGDNSIEDGFSRLGFAGSSQLDNGLVGFGNIEIRSDMSERNQTFTLRNSFLGVKGDFGSVRAGNFDSIIYSNVTGVADLAYGSNTGFGFVGDGGHQAHGDTIAFDSADLDGFTFSVAVNHTQDDDQDDVWNVQATASFQATPDLAINVGVNQNNDDNPAELIPNQVAFDGPMVSATAVFTGVENLVLGAAFETAEVVVGNTEERLLHFGALGIYNYGQGNVYGLASFLQLDDLLPDDTGFQVMVGADYNLGDNFLVFGEVATATDTLNTMTPGSDQTNVALGARYHW